MSASAIEMVKDMPFIVIAPDWEGYDTRFCYGRDLVKTLAGMLYMSADDMPDEDRAELEERASNPDNWWQFEGVPTKLDWDIASESGCIIQAWRLTADAPRMDVQRRLIALARAAWALADGSEDAGEKDDTGASYIRVPEDLHKALSDGLDELDKLPELPAPYIGEGPAKAEFALGIGHVANPKDPGGAS